MLWFLVLHIATMLVWCAALLFLTVLISRQPTDLPLNDPAVPALSMSRFLYTHIATPAALAAIITGTAVFLLDRNASAWLIVKLSLVTALVVTHTLTGLLVLRAENRPTATRSGWCVLALTIQCLLMSAILWVVLAKPDVVVPL